MSADACGEPDTDATACGEPNTEDTEDTKLQPVR
jgi:hypothetical protein